VRGRRSENAYIWRNCNGDCDALVGVSGVSRKLGLSETRDGFCSSNAPSMRSLRRETAYGAGWRGGRAWRSCRCAQCVDATRRFGQLGQLGKIDQLPAFASKGLFQLRAGTSVEVQHDERSRIKVEVFVNQTFHASSA
jgi:hypothetical protein